MDASCTEARTVDRGRLEDLLARERRSYAERNPRSIDLFSEARRTLLAGVPMSWMAMWRAASRFFTEARGDRITDVDGHTYIDFCLGDTGAMTGHSPAIVMAAVNERISERGGITTMLPTEDAAVVGAELQRRFGLPDWQFTLSATDANRIVLRMARQITKRPKVLVFSMCYHGSVDETVIILGGDGVPVSKPGSVGPQIDPTLTSKVVEFNDIAALREALAPRDVAVVLMEPAMTNVGIAAGARLPGAGPSACDQTGTLLINDETHTFSAGVGGCTRAGPAPRSSPSARRSARGIPIGAYGVSERFAERILADGDADLLDQGGVGGTLAGTRCPRRGPRHLDARPGRSDRPDGGPDDALTRGVQDALDRHRAPWVIVQSGPRRISLLPGVPRTGNESAAAHDAELDEYLHLYTINRGILMTPFQKMALTGPATSAEDVDRHTRCSASVAERFVCASSAGGRRPAGRRPSPSSRAGRRVAARRHHSVLNSSGLSRLADEGGVAAQGARRLQRILPALMVGGLRHRGRRHEAVVVVEHALAMRRVGLVAHDVGGAGELLHVVVHVQALVCHDDVGHGDDAQETLEVTAPTSSQAACRRSPVLVGDPSDVAVALVESWRSASPQP